MTKQQWRARLLAARRARPEASVADARCAISKALLAALVPAIPPAVPAGAALVVCAYLPLPSEPLAPDLPALLAAAGARVLVPVAHPGRALDWCEFGGPTRPGMLGVAEPVGPRLGADAVRHADVVLVPALAVDRAGVRLGRGGGHYDRSLALVAGRVGAHGVRLIAVVFDDEVLPRLPREPYDVPVGEVVTPSGGLVPLGGPGATGGPGSAGEPGSLGAPRHVASRHPDGASSN